MSENSGRLARRDLGRDLERARALARLMDSAVEIPVIGVRLGIDALLGLLPGVGDATSALVGAYPVLLALRHRLPPFVVARLLGNIALDATLGSVPLIGDIFDIGFKSNLRNQRLIERYAMEPGRTTRSSNALMIAAIGGLVLIVAALVALAIWLVKQGTAALMQR